MFCLYTLPLARPAQAKIQMLMTRWRVIRSNLLSLIKFSRLYLKFFWIFGIQPSLVLSLFICFDVTGILGGIWNSLFHDHFLGFFKPFLSVINDGIIVGILESNHLCSMTIFFKAFQTLSSLSSAFHSITGILVGNWNSTITFP